MFQHCKCIVAYAIKSINCTIKAEKFLLPYIADDVILRSFDDAFSDSLLK